MVFHITNSQKIHPENKDFSQMEEKVGVLEDLISPVILVKGIGVIVFNAIFNTILVLKWRSVLLVEETRVPAVNIELSQVTDKLDHIMLYQVHISERNSALKKTVR